MTGSREEAYMFYEDFVKKFDGDELHIELDKSKSLNLMSSKYAPNEWRYTLKFFSWLSILLIPTGIVGFFFWPIWLPILLLVLAIFIGKGVRKTARDAVVELSRKDSEFYKIARNTDTMFVYKKES